MGNSGSTSFGSSPKPKKPPRSPTANLYAHHHKSVNQPKEDKSILGMISLRGFSRKRIGVISSNSSSSFSTSLHGNRSHSNSDHPQYLEEVSSLRHSLRQTGTIQPQEKLVFVLFAPPEYPTVNAAEYLSQKINLPVIYPHEYIIEEDQEEDSSSHHRIETITNLSTKILLRKKSSIQEISTRQLLHDRIVQEDCCNGFILYEYPETISEMKYFKTNLVPTMRVELIFLQLNHEMMRKLQYKFDRWVHLKSGRSYHLLFNPPKNRSNDLLSPPSSHENMIDDITGEALVQLTDDLPETYKEKFQRYQIKEIPMFYEFEECAHEVPGAVSEAEVHK
jgi:adenylate kinase family enzyme